MSSDVAVQYAAENGGKGQDKPFDSYEEYSSVLGAMKPMSMENGEFAYNLEYMTIGSDAKDGGNEFHGELCAEGAPGHVCNVCDLP